MFAQSQGVLAWHVELGVETRLDGPANPFRFLKYSGGAGSSHQVSKAPSRAMSEQRHLPGTWPDTGAPMAGQV